MAHAYCGQTAGWNRIPPCTEIGLGPGDVVRWGRSSPTEGGTTGPTFRPTLLWHCCPSHLLLSTCISGRPKTVRPAIGPLSVCPACLSVTLVYCGQTVGWIRMPLGMVVVTSAQATLLDGDPAPPTERRTAAPHLGRRLLRPNGRPSQLLLSSSTFNNHLF